MALELEAPFDAAEYITDAETQAELLSDALASGDRAYIAKALGTVARARGGLTKLATETGLQRQALHRALGDNGNPRLDTILKVIAALGFRLTAQEAA